MEIDKEPSLLTFRLDPRSGVPTYLQLVQQVEHALRIGHLREGDQLPRLKDVVSLLSINPNTVQKAYKELETRGIAAGRPGIGTFVVAAPETIGLDRLAALRQRLVTGWLREASEAGLDEDGIVSIFRVALADLREKTPSRRAPRRQGGVA